jgi:hypothetical protein
MITDSAEIILFAIRSAVKLSQQIRLAYVDSTRRREITLPLPKFFNGTTTADAADFFETDGLGKQFVGESAAQGPTIPGSKRLPDLLNKFHAHQLQPKEEQELINLHILYRNTLSAQEGGWSWDGDRANGFAAPNEVFALLCVQQWQDGTDPSPSTLRRMAGTLVEIGIDYALTAPGLFDKNSRQGKALVGFLNALGDIDFKEDELSEMPARLFAAVLDTVGEQAALLTGDLKVQELVKVTTKALSSDIVKRLKDIDADPNLDAIGRRNARSNAQDWTELVFRSTLASGGRLVLSDPAKFLGVKGDGNNALIASVGTSVLDLVLADGGKFGNVLSREGLETILKSALTVVANHPEILTKTNNEGIKKLLSGLASDLAGTQNLLSLDVLPEVARMALERTGENLELFWPDLANNPEKNLLLVAAKTTLQLLSRPVAAGEKWRPTFSRDDLLSVTETVLDELVKNPGWLLDDAGNLSPLLQDVINSTLNVLRNRADKRLSATTGVEVLRSVLTTIALRQDFAKKLPNGQPMITAIVDALLAILFPAVQSPAAAWRLVGTETVTAITQTALTIMARHGLNNNALNTLTTTLQSEINNLVNGQALDLDRFAKNLETSLAE